MTENTTNAEQDISSDKSSNTPPKEKDSLDIVTPYAFAVDENLLGKNIARPWRRGLAQCLDCALIAVLSQLPSLLLALLASIAFFRASRRNNHKIQSTAAKRLLRIGGTVLLFLFAIPVFDTLREYERDQEKTQDAKLGLLIGANKLAWKACNGEMDCLNNAADSIGEAMAEASLPRESFKEYIHEYLLKKELNEADTQQLRTRYIQAFDQHAPAEEIHTDKTQLANTTGVEDSQLESSESLVEQLQGSAGDFGIGIGWAALYHSVFVAWFFGRTPGKKLLKIRAVKLDGTKFSLWDSFGRYGGYGAGLATGFLGFLQIYWDSNRQAIQDKISETVVIYER